MNTRLLRRAGLGLAMQLVLAGSRALAAEPSPSAWVVLQDFSTRPVAELQPGWAYIEETLSGPPSLICFVGEGCYPVQTMQRCDDPRVTTCRTRQGTRLQFSPAPPAASGAACTAAAAAGQPAATAATAATATARPRSHRCRAAARFCCRAAHPAVGVA